MDSLLSNQLILFPTISSDPTPTGGHYGDSHHDESTSTPAILHQELFQHNIPQSLHEYQVRLLGQCFICLRQQVLFNLYINILKKMKG